MATKNSYDLTIRKMEIAWEIAQMIEKSKSYNGGSQESVRESLTFARQLVDDLFPEKTPKRQGPGAPPQVIEQL